MKYKSKEEQEQYERFHYSEEERKKLEGYDFFQKQELSAKESGIPSVLAWGQKSGSTPLVSVILTTYKRPQMLREALESVLMQKGFGDFEIIVADNEGAALQVKPDTHRLIEEINDKRILYYRHAKTVANNFDRGAMLADGEWICFLHDDDLLSPVYMKKMTEAVKQYPEINWLSCSPKEFRDRMPQGWQSAEEINEGCKIYKVNPRYYSFWFDGKWQGAFIRRKCYVQMGGFPNYNSGMADYVMTAKFAYYFNHYECGLPLYLTRIWGGQDSSSSAGLWMNICIKEYFFYRYAVGKYFKTAKIFKTFWANLCFYQIMTKMELMERGSHGFALNREAFCRLIGEKNKKFTKLQKGIYHLIADHYKKAKREIGK